MTYGAENLYVVLYVCHVKIFMLRFYIYVPPMFNVAR